MKLFSRTSLVALGTAAVVAFSGVSAANAEPAAKAEDVIEATALTPAEKAEDKSSGSSGIFDDLLDGKKKDEDKETTGSSSDNTSSDANGAEGDDKEEGKANGSSTDNLDLAGWIKIIAAIFSALTAAVTFASKIGLFR